ncbi:MAG: dihydrofolate reductase family protein [Emergencia sp.]
MKRKVILYMAMSLDGYIADKAETTGWRRGESEFYQGDYGRSGFLSIVDTVIMGMNTYKELKCSNAGRPWPYEDMITYVITHRPEEDTENIRFVDSRMSTFIQKLQQEEGGNIYVCGGADIANQLVRENLIDEYHLTIMPVILGGGTRLFNDKNKEIKLHLVRNTEKNGVIDCLYERI